MEWLETDPLPIECQNCLEDDCYNCDIAGQRWYLSPEDAFQLQCKGIANSVTRLQKRMEQTDSVIKKLEAGSRTI